MNDVSKFKPGDVVEGPHRHPDQRWWAIVGDGVVDEDHVSLIAWRHVDNNCEWELYWNGATYRGKCFKIEDAERADAVLADYTRAVLTRRGG